MSIILLQIENRSIPFFKRAMARNYAYCNKFGLEYISLERGRDDVSFYWSKSFEIARILEERTDVDAVVWMDSDAFVFDMNFDIRRLLQEHSGTGMIVTPNLPLWPWSSLFNAGVFIVYNNIQGKRIIQKWKSLYDVSAWRKTGRTWACIAPGCVYAGELYEDGSFIKHILLNTRYSSDITVIPYHVLQEYDWSNPHPSCFSMHLAADLKRRGEEALAHIQNTESPPRPPATPSKNNNKHLDRSLDDITCTFGSVSAVVLTLILLMNIVLRGIRG